MHDLHRIVRDRFPLPAEHCRPAGMFRFHDSLADFQVNSEITGVPESLTGFSAERVIDFYWLFLVTFNWLTRAACG